MNKKFAAIAVGLVAAVGLTGCSVPSTANDEIAVHRGGGPLESQSPKGCVPAGTRQVNSAFDNYYYYPKNQRIFDFTGGDFSDSSAFTVVSADEQVLTVPGTLTFELNIDCDVLSKFHDTVGARYQAYNTESGQPTNDGWARMLDTTLGKPIDAALDRVAKQYSWRELYSDPTIKDEMNKAVNETLARLVNQQLTGDEEFFLNFSSLIQQPLADQTLVDSLKQEEASKQQAAAAQVKAEADAAAARAAAEAQVAQKQAELEVAQLQADIKQAEIDAYGGVEQYNNAKAIEQGLNPYQPVYVFGGAIPK